MIKVKCLKCGDIVNGDEKGHLIRCKCGKIAVDDTPYYSRILGEYDDYKILESEYKGR